MIYEVEQKFPVADMAAVAEKLAAMGAKIGAPRTEVDLYFAHPARDFRDTDEALRIRRRGPASFITYKGPKVDQTTKTRTEIELPLGGGAASADAWEELLEVLGFRPVAEVRKSRRPASVAWQDREVTVALDDVEQVGVFVELELTADDDGLVEARTCIASLAEALGLCGGERRSYLELLLEGS